MDFTFTDDQLAFRDAVRDLLADRCPPSAVRTAWEAARPWDDGRWSALAEMGALGATIAEPDDGLGLGLVDVVLLAEESGRAALPEPIVDTAIVAPALLAAAGGEAASWTAPIAAGDAKVVVALSESEWVAGAADADLVLQREGDALVGYTAASWDVEPSVDRARRLARRSAGEPAFRVDDLGGPLDAAFDRGATAVAAQLVGVARHLLDTTVAYAQEREQFGQPIGGFQAIKHHLADALLAVEFAAPVVYRAAWSLDREAPTAPRDASMAKAMAGDAAEQAARAALQVHGAIGYTFEYDLHLWMKRVWVLAADWRDADWHRERVASSVLGAA
jgi:alkylation response protein AidB-like acyl-CoA dehydrogenase